MVKRIFRPASSLKRVSKRQRKWAGCGSGIILLLCCGVIAVIGQSMGGGKKTPTPDSDLIKVAPSATVAERIQQIPLNTSTLGPAATSKPAQTVSQPTNTKKPQVKPTATTVAGGVCDCSRDYNCSDFNTQRKAQSCFDSCGGNNWSGLDRDGDGKVCESLP